jgi:hypothetical protein
MRRSVKHASDSDPRTLAVGPQTFMYIACGVG